MQRIIRGIPPALTEAQRERARAAGKSLDETAIDELDEGVALVGAPRKRRDCGEIAGTWRGDKKIEDALADQDEVHEDLWK